MKTQFCPGYSRTSTGRLRPGALPLVAWLATLLSIAGHTPATAVTYTVPSASYPTIQSAVNAVPTNTALTQPYIIEVSAGTYLERVLVQNKLGSASNPLIIKAMGTVTIDGSDNPTTWTQCSTTPPAWTTTLGANFSTPYDSDLVSVNGVLYANAQTQNCTLQTGQYSYNSSTHEMTLNLGSGMPPAAIYVKIRNQCFDILTSNYVTIDGFIARGARQQGVRVLGADSTSRAVGVMVKNCEITDNARQGIHFQFASTDSAFNNKVHHNYRHGLYLFTSDHCVLRGNESYKNDHPLRPGIKGAMTGIKVGDAPDNPPGAFVTNVTDITVENNIVHDNEDSGIDLKSATTVLVRQNVSYRNGDHGYDNLNTNATTFVNNVAARNDHDGISVESTASNVRVFNCIFVQDGVNPLTLASAGYVRELAI